jgi:hypothetical protein
MSASRCAAVASVGFLTTSERDDVDSRAVPLKEPSSDDGTTPRTDIVRVVANGCCGGGCSALLPLPPPPRAARAVVAGVVVVDNVSARGDCTIPSFSHTISCWICRTSCLQAEHTTALVTRHARQLDGIGLVLHTAAH